MTANPPPRAPLDSAALAQLFTQARTHNGFLDTPVPDALLHQALDLAKWGPTAANISPLRILFLRSAEAKERLRPALAPGNVDKTVRAPVVAITAYDVKFAERLPFLFPQVDARPWYADPAVAERAAFQSGTLQVAYFLLALRAVGLDAGPMTGFVNAAVDKEFFPEGAVKSNVLINIGYGDVAKLYPRNPRLSFDQIAKIL